MAAAAAAMAARDVLKRASALVIAIQHYTNVNQYKEQSRLTRAIIANANAKATQHGAAASSRQQMQRWRVRYR
jgi:hypothetical protein